MSIEIIIDRIDSDIRTIDNRTASIYSILAELLNMALDYGDRHMQNLVEEAILDTQVIGSTLASLNANIGSLIDYATDASQDWLSSIVDKLRNYINGISTTIEDLAYGLYDWFERLTTRIWNAIDNLGEYFANAMSTVFNAFKRYLDEILSAIVGQLFLLIAKVADVASSIKEVLVNSFDKITEGFKDAMEYLWDKLRDTIHKIIDRVESFIEDFPDRIEKIFNDALDFFKSLFTLDPDRLEEFFEMLSQVQQRIMQKRFEVMSR